MIADLEVRAQVLQIGLFYCLFLLFDPELPPLLQFAVCYRVYDDGYDQFIHIGGHEACEILEQEHRSGHITRIERTSLHHKLPYCFNDPF